jgi:hypothetical protein
MAKGSSVCTLENSQPAQNVAGEDILRRLTPLSAVQEAILQGLGLGTNLYRHLEIQNMKN